MSKKWTRRSALALIGGGAGLLTWGTGGFTDVTADRQVNINTTEDSSDGPLLGIKSLGDSGGPGQTVSLITLQNNLGEKVTEIALNDAKVNSDDSTELADLFKGERGAATNYFDTPGSVGTGDGGTIEATLNLLPEVSIGSDRKYNVTLDFTASTANKKVTLERETTVTYEDPRLSYWDFEQITPNNPSVPDDWGNSGASRPSDYWPSLTSSGQRGRVLYFNGYNASIGSIGNINWGDINRGNVTQISDNSKLDFTEGDDFSLSVWIRPYSIPNSSRFVPFAPFARLFSKWDSSIEKGYQFFLGKNDYRFNNKFEIGIETGQKNEKTTVIKTGATVGEGNWNHVVWTHRSSKPSEDRVYVNGDYENNGYSGDLKDPFGSDEPLRIGNGIDGNGNLIFPFNGPMDEPKAYDTALTSEQVQNLYETSTGGDGGSIGG